jgi:hypothetical protein
VGKILESIQSISDEARRVLADPELTRDSLLSALSVSVIKASLFQAELTGLLRLSSMKIIVILSHLGCHILPSKRSERPRPTRMV